MGLLTPWFFFGLLALGVPVFVHLLKRHRTVPRLVSSLMFFERGTQSSNRHRRLKHPILFALRAALLTLIALAFANPFLRRPGSDASHHLLFIVLDNSFSMRVGTRFADAKRQALTLLAAKPSSQQAQILVMGGQVQVLTQPDSDASHLRSALESIQAADGHASFGELGRAVRTLREGSHSSVDLHLFSDMQKTAMPAIFADMVFPAETKLVLHAVTGAAALPNWTVASVDAPAELADTRDPKHSRVIAVIAGFNTPIATKRVSLVVNGLTIANKQVNVPANGRVNVEFSPLNVTYGFNRCQVRVDAQDAFPNDDASLFAVRRSDPKRVLFVRANGDTRSQLYFGAALAAAAQASFTLQATPAAAADDIDPSKFAFVVLADAFTLPPVFERNLRDYVHRGGNVLVALGTGAGHRAVIPLWGSAVKQVNEYAHGGAGPVSVGQIDFAYPAFEDAQPGVDNGGWAATRILYAAVVEAAGARIAARLSDGTPLLLDRTVGEGHVVVFTTGFDNLTNDLPLHPVFVAFIDRVARYLSGTDGVGGSRRVDSDVQLRAGGDMEAVHNSEVVDPEGKRPLSLAEARAAQRFRLDRAGFYQVRFANGKDALIGVNPDRLESDLQPMPVDLQQLWSGSNPASAHDTKPTVYGTRDEQGSRPVSLWWYVMLLAFVVAVAEMILASGYMGTRRGDA